MNPCQITVSKSYDATINRFAASSTEYRGTVKKGSSL